MIFRTFVNILIILILSNLCFAGNDSPFSIRVESLEREKVLLDISAKPGDRFYINYIHSSDKTPIRDTFKVDAQGQIILIEEAFLWHGAGLEFQGHEGVQVSYDNKWIRVLLNRPFFNLPLRVGRISQQHLILHGQSYRLDKLARPGNCIILSIAR